MYRIIDRIAEILPPEIAQYWWGLGSKGPTYVLYGEIALAGTLWLIGMYYGVRWALGHRKALGQWWKRHEFDTLIQHLYDEHRAGRVLAHEEIRLLRKHTEGSTKTISKQSAYY